MKMSNAEMANKIKQGRGFIAALDQSGGSTPKALAGYGIDESAWSNEEEMFGLIHEMRCRIITSPVFTGEKVLGAAADRGRAAGARARPRADRRAGGEHQEPPARRGRSDPPRGAHHGARRDARKPAVVVGHLGLADVRQLGAGRPGECQRCAGELSSAEHGYLTSPRA